MLTLEQIRLLLKDRRLTVVSKEIGVSYPTILAIYKGESKNPNYETIEKLSEYLERK
jgi:transcriptional regulator with XRE-family HTH domain